MCPVKKRLANAPRVPVLIKVPNWPLLKPKLAFTSGNLGTQAIIKIAKTKKSTCSSLSSTFGETVFI
jgi:hypothetical protein